MQSAFDILTFDVLNREIYFILFFVWVWFGFDLIFTLKNNDDEMVQQIFISFHFHSI